jgi:hypothetical protein
MESTVRTAPRLAGCSAALATRLGGLVDEPGVELAPVAAHNAPHLPRYQRSRALLQQAQQRMQQDMATRAEAWEQAHGHVPVPNAPAAARGWPASEQPPLQLVA